jgi:hypothetical protein
MGTLGERGQGGYVGKRLTLEVFHPGKVEHFAALCRTFRLRELRQVQARIIGFPEVDNMRLRGDPDCHAPRPPCPRGELPFSISPRQ